ncbi:STAS domain-containing protein [Croceivirga thetidis]|uniref:STAS domain-containing protein n=1 Tax=Croceivirga thetidis TaxID=2721623 RepID=A0ABX1GNS9_9FLAO|nr:STAS domain-containing protein [Croceivirga thetidis]NKI30715.1 hypothetical protein [Croceivirga thetidis]
MALHITERNNIIHLKGNLTTSNIRSLSSYLMHLYETRAKVSIDLNRVDEISKEVARELFRLKKNAEAVNRKLVFFYNETSELVEDQLIVNS